MSASSPPFAFADGGPERLMRVDGLAWRDRDVLARMTTGPWLRSPAGRPGLGALGVLVDNVLGRAIMGQGQDAPWSVSLEIGIDLVGRLPLDGSVLSAVGVAQERDARGGLATAEVRDASGAVVALARQRGFSVPRPTEPPGGLETGPAVDVSSDDLLALLGGRLQRGTAGAVLVMEADPRVTNPLGNLHGGISLCAVEQVAAACLDGPPSPLHPVSVQVTYVRPVPSGAQVAFTAQALHRGRSVGLVHVVGAVAGGPPCVVGTVVAQAG
ncbi:MAG: hypothetical protein JWN17_2076 [Frankiales bacterium]|nr:hypothetical protein [Frankiales bacterium]